MKKLCLLVLLAATEWKDVTSGGPIYPLIQTTHYVMICSDNKCVSLKPGTNFDKINNTCAKKFLEVLAKDAIGRESDEKGLKRRAALYNYCPELRIKE